MFERSKGKICIEKEKLEWKKNKRIKKRTIGKETKERRWYSRSQQSIEKRYCQKWVS